MSKCDFPRRPASQLTKYTRTTAVNSNTDILKPEEVRTQCASKLSTLVTPGDTVTQKVELKGEVLINIDVSQLKKKSISFRSVAVPPLNLESLVSYQREGRQERRKVKIRRKPVKCERGEIIRKAVKDVESVKRILNSQSLIETSFNIVKSHVTNI